MTAADVLALHVGHRTVLTDPRHLRCVDCDRTIVLPAGPSGAGSTSTSEPRGPECKAHPGRLAIGCRGCRADRIAAESPVRRVRTGADPLQNEEWLKAREALAQKTARKGSSAAAPATNPPPVGEDAGHGIPEQ